MHVKLSPALPSKNNYANAPVSQCVQWILKNLGFPQRAGARCYQKNTNLHNPPPEHTNNQSKGDIESIPSIHYTVYFLPHTFVLGAFLVLHNLQLGTELCVFFKMNPRHRGIGGAATWELVLWHSGSSRARCNSKRSSCKGGRLTGWQVTG